MNGSYALVVYLLALRFCTDMRGHGSDWFEDSCEGVSLSADIYTLGYSLTATDLKETWLMEYLLRGA